MGPLLRRSRWLGAALALAVLAGLQGPASAGAQAATEIPQYGGDIQPLRAAVPLRYQPFQGATLAQSGEVTATEGSRSVTYAERSSGRVQSLAVGEQIAISVRLDADSERRRGRARDGTFLIRFLVSDLGELRDVVAKLPSGEIETVESTPALQIMGDELRDALPRFPPTGVRAGDKIFQGRYDVGPEIGLPSGAIPVSTSGTVRGLTTFNGRRCLLVDYLAEGRGSGFTYREQGYRLVDLATGMLSRAQTVTFISAPDRDLIRAAYAMSLRFD